MENKIEWHGVAPKADEAEKAKKEIRSMAKATRQASANR